MILKGANQARATLAALLAAAALTGAAAQVPCSATKEVAPGEVRHFLFQRAGYQEDLLCCFTFQTQLGEPLAVLLNYFNFDNTTERDCECGDLRMYDVSPSGELVSKVRRCAGDAANGSVLVASSSLAVVTLSTHACLGPVLELSVGAPDAVGVAPGDGGGDGGDGNGGDEPSTTEAPPATRPQPTPTRAPVVRRTTPTTATARPTRTARQADITTTSDADDDTSTTTKKSGHWWSG